MLIALDGQLLALRPARPPIAIARIEPERAQAVLQQRGVRPEVARLIAYGALDSAAAQRLARQYGLVA